MCGADDDDDFKWHSRFVQFQFQFRVHSCHLVYMNITFDRVRNINTSTHVDLNTL